MSYGSPSYYTDKAIETCEKQDMIADILQGSGMDAKRIHAAMTAIKYVDRLGEKDAIEKDAYKAADYLHRFATGKWIGEVHDAD